MKHTTRRPALVTVALATALVVVALAPLARALAAPPKVTFGYATDDLEKAKRGGFEYVELGVRNFVKLSDEEFAKFLERHKAVGLPTPVGNNFIPGDLKVVGPELDKDKQMEHVRKAFDRAKQLGLKVIVFGSGGARKVPDGFSKEQAFDQLVEFAKRIAPEAKKRGVVVAVEPLQSKETNIINSAAEGLKWVKAVNHPNFQLMVDFYHLSLEKEDPAILISARRHIKHIHIANPNGRVFPLSSEEYDYSKFFAALRKSNYRGGISIEGRSQDYDNDAPKALAFLRAAWESGVKPPASAPAPPAPAADARGATPTNVAPVAPAAK